MYPKDPRFPGVRMQGSREPFDTPQRVPGTPNPFPAQLPQVAGGAPSGASIPTPTAMPIYDPHHYARLSDLSTSLPDATSTLLLEVSPTRRNFLMFRNNSGAGGANIYIAFARTADANATLRLEPNQIALFDSVVPQDDVYVFADAASGVLSYAFSNIAA